MICTPGSVVRRRELTVEWKNLDNKELHDLHYRQCCAKEGTNSGMEKFA
jgi:hypothetical protein